jgi:hypothetical protein
MNRERVKSLRIEMRLAGEIRTESVKKFLEQASSLFPLTSSSAQSIEREGTSRGRGLTISHVLRFGIDKRDGARPMSRGTQIQGADSNGRSHSPNATLCACKIHSAEC